MSYKKINALIFLVTLNNLLQAADNTPQRPRNWMSSIFGSCMQIRVTTHADQIFETGEYIEIINTDAEIIPPSLAQATVAHTENEEIQRLNNQIGQNDQHIKDLETLLRTERQRHKQTLQARIRIHIELQEVQRKSKKQQKLIEQRTEQLAIMENSAQELTLDLQEKEDNQILIENFSRQFNQQADELEKTLSLKLKSQNTRLDHAKNQLIKISTRFTVSSEE